MKLTDQQRAELKALSDAATPGPWRIGSLESYDGYSGKPYRNVWQGQGEDARTIARTILDQGNEQTDVDADAMFIAAAREAVPALLADLEEAERKAGESHCDASHYAAENARLAEELERLRELAATAEKWRGIACAKFGDGRTVAEIQREAAEEEREACAQICDAEASIEGVAQRCATAIRARNEKGGS